MHEDKTDDMNTNERRQTCFHRSCLQEILFQTFLSWPRLAGALGFHCLPLPMVAIFPSVSRVPSPVNRPKCGASEISESLISKMVNGTIFITRMR